MSLPTLTIQSKHKPNPSQGETRNVCVNTEREMIFHPLCWLGMLHLGAAVFSGCCNLFYLPCLTFSCGHSIANCFIDQFCRQEIRGDVSGLGAELDDVKTDDVFLLSDVSDES